MQAFIPACPIFENFVVSRLLIKKADVDLPELCIGVIVVNEPPRTVENSNGRRETIENALVGLHLLLQIFTQILDFRAIDGDCANALRQRKLRYVKQMPFAGDTRFPESIPLDRWKVISEVQQTYRERKSGCDVLCRFLQYEQENPQLLR